MFVKPAEREEGRRLRRNEGRCGGLEESKPRHPGQPRFTRVALAAQRPRLRTASVTVNSTAIVQSIYGAIQHYAGIERPEWVDGRLPSAAPP
jgi:hypothetical protein